MSAQSEIADPPSTMNVKIMRACIWSGPVLIVGMLIAMVPLMHFLPPPPPSETGAQIRQRFLDRQFEVRVGAVIMLACWSLWATWASTIVLFTRKMERGWPILTYASMALVGSGCVYFVFIPLTWGLAAFRPEALDPNTTRLLNDAVWFVFLFNWQPFSLWCLIIALAIFNDRNVPTLYPRWVGYLNIWAAVFFVPAGLVGFFKQGLFAWNGLGAFWIPFFVFFGWIVVMTVMALRVTARYADHAAAAPASPAAATVPG